MNLIAIAQGKELINYYPHHTTANRLDTIVDVVCKVYNVKREKLISKSRKQPWVTARQFAMYFAMKYEVTTQSQIGLYFAKRDHSTVSYARKKVISLMQIYPYFRNIHDNVEKELEKLSVFNPYNNQR